MKRVYSSHDAVAHAWAHQTSDTGRASRVFFNGDTIYSYGTHFPIARHLSPGVVLFTSKDYSVSTSGHKSLVRRAILPGTKVIYCPNPRDTKGDGNRCEFEEQIKAALAAATAPRIREATRAKHLATAARLTENANEYAAAMGEEWRLELPPGTVEQAREWQAKADIREAEKRRKADIAALEGIDLWKARERNTAPHTSNAYLRLSTDGTRVETSWGATVPVEHARRAWPLLRPVVKGEAPAYQRNGHTIHLGEYAVESASPEFLRVGCHTIPAQEVLAIAAALALPV